MTFCLPQLIGLPVYKLLFYIRLHRVPGTEKLYLKTLLETEIDLSWSIMDINGNVYSEVTFKQILDASVSCPNGKSLFEVSCTIAEGFDIRINESCRKAYFPFIDFTNSFVWGKILW